MSKFHSFFILAFLQCFLVTGFVIPVSKEIITSTSRSPRHSPFHCNQEALHQQHRHLSFRKQRRSVANIQTCGLFGLGGPEIAVILVAAGFLIGPEQLGNFVGKLKSDYDDVPEELKKIPEEFKKGVEEGEITARARNAKQMEQVPEKPSLPEQSD